MRHTPGFVGILVPRECLDWVKRVAPKHERNHGARVGWLLRAAMTAGDRLAMLRSGQLERLRRIAPPAIACQDASVVVQWALGRFVDLIDRSFEERAGESATQVRVAGDPR